MLYYMTALVIFMMCAYAGIVLFKRSIDILKRRDEQEKKETEFINNLLTSAELEPDPLFPLDNCIPDNTADKRDFRAQGTGNSSDGKGHENMGNTYEELGINEVRAFIYQIINSMSEDQLRILLKELEEGQNRERRQHDRKDFFRIVDYNVEDRYFRDFIQNISEEGVFIQTFQTFSTGQTIQMTFMSPDDQKPFKINGEIIRVHTDGVGVKFKIKSQVQKSTLKSIVNRIQSNL